MSQNAGRVIGVVGRPEPHQSPAVRPDRRALMKQEMLRLEEEAKVLERDWKRAPYLGLGVVLALPVYSVWGGIAAALVVLCAPALVGTALYLLGVRRSENRQLHDELVRELERAEREAA